MAYYFQAYYQPIFSIQFSSVAQLCLTLGNPMDCSTSGLPLHHQLPEFTQTHVQQVGDAIQPSHPLSSPSLPVFNLSQHQGLSNASVFCIRWPKFWSFGFSISLSNERSGLISFRIDWFYLLAVQGTWDFSSTTVRRHQFFVTQPFLLSGSHIHT